MTDDTLIRRYRYRIMPTARQAAALARTIEVCSRVYSESIAMLTADPTTTLGDLSRRLVTGRDRDTSSVARQETVRTAWRAHRGAGQPGARGHRRSAGWVGRYSMYVRGVGDGSDGGRVYLGRIGPVSVRWTRPLPSRPTSATVIRDGDRWWISFVVAVPVTTLGPPVHAACGIDVGLTHLATIVDDAGDVTTIPAMPARTTPGQRTDGHRKLARRLVTDYGTVVVEDLDIVPMTAGPRAGRVRRAGWGILLRRLAEVAELYDDREVLAVDPAGTSCRCSGCGHDAGRGPWRRTLTCPRCGLTEDRDERAGRNLLAAAGPAAHGDKRSCRPALPAA